MTPEILLIDEALAVGDKGFKAKSAARISAMLANAGTLLLVSHSMPELQSHCNRGIWIDQGIVRMDGPIDDVVECYSAEA